MRQRIYAVALVLLLAAIVVGAFFGGRFVIQRFRQDFQFRREWSPSEWTPSPATTVPTIPPAPTAHPSNTPIVVPTPIAPSPEPYTPAPAATSRPTEEITPVSEQTAAPIAQPSETPTSESTQVSSEPFQAKAAVRYTRGDCGGTYVLGFVMDRAGERLPGIRLRLEDEYDNEAFAVTKAGQADLGRYDFPVAGPPRRFSIAIVDESGSTLSPPVGVVYYGDSPDAQATCYWIDWQRR
jgi:hypothetical protein